MNWTEQAETMTKAWAEAQKKMWESWYDLNQASPASAPYADMVKQWRKMTAQNVDTWMANAEPTVKEVARRLIAGQESFVRLLEFSADTWKTVAAKMESKENWQEALEAYTDQLRQELLEWPEKMLKVSQNSSELWRLYMEEIQKMAQPWLQSWQQTNGHFGQAIAGDGSALLELLKHYSDAYDHTFGHLLESPSLGYTRELNEKILRGFDAWQELHEVNFEYQVILIDAWVKVLEQFQDALVARAEKEEPIESLEGLANLWYDVADSAFIEVFRSDEYIRTQGRLLSATLTYRIRQREIIELYLKINDLPTRTEVDQAHRNIYEQRKEIKSLKKALAQLKREAGTRTELEKATRTVDALQAEVKTLKESLAQVSAQAKQVDSLRKELDALKKSGETAPPTSTKKSKRATPSGKASPTKQSSVSKQAQGEEDN